MIEIRRTKQKIFLTFMLKSLLGFIMLFHAILEILSGAIFIKKIFLLLNLPEFLAYGVYFAEVIASIMLFRDFKLKNNFFVLIGIILFLTYIIYKSIVLSFSIYEIGTIVFEIVYIFITLVIFFQYIKEYVYIKDGYLG